MGMIFTTLTESPRPSHTNDANGLVSDDGFQPRRRQRRLRGSDGDEIVININDKFEPTAEMLDIQKKIERYQLAAIRVYRKMLSLRSSTPQIQILREFKGLMQEVSYHQKRYRDAERQAQEEFKLKRENEARRISGHEERATETLRVYLRDLVDTLSPKRAEFKAESEARKARIRQERQRRHQGWQGLRIAQTVQYLQEVAEEQYAEGEVPPDTFRKLTQFLNQLPETANPAEAVSDAYVDGLLSRDNFMTLQRVCR